MPQPFPLERVLTDQLLSEHTIYEVFEYHRRARPREQRDTFGALVRTDSKYRTVTGWRAAAEAVPPLKGRVGRRYLDSVRFNVRDLHCDFLGSTKRSIAGAASTFSAEFALREGGERF